MLDMKEYVDAGNSYTRFATWTECCGLDVRYRVEFVRTEALTIVNVTIAKAMNFKEKYTTNRCRYTGSDEQEFSTIVLGESQEYKQIYTGNQ